MDTQENQPVNLKRKKEIPVFPDKGGVHRPIKDKDGKIIVDESPGTYDKKGKPKPPPEKPGRIIDKSA